MTNRLRDPESPRVAKWRLVSRILGGALLVIAFLVIAGWALGFESLRSGAPGLPPTKVNTAFGFIALGLWLAFLWRGEKSNRPLGVLCWGCCLFIALLGLFTIAEYFSGGDFGIDQFLFGAGLPNADGTFPTRMAPTAALNFVLLGAAILLLQKETARMFSSAQWAALLSLGTSFCAVIGYGYGIRQFEQSAPFAPMALSTAVGFLIAGFGFLVGTAKMGWMSAAVAETSGGWLLRRLVPLTLVAATALGWLRLRGEVLGWYRPAIGTAVLVLMLVAIYSTALWINSRLIDRADVEAQHHREWLRVTLGSIGDAVIATDMEGRVTFLNSIAESLTGWDAISTQGQPIDTIFSLVNEATGEPCFSPVPEVLRTGETVGLTNQTALLSKDGTRTSIADSAAPIRDAAGHMIGVVMVFRDVTERRRAQLERRRAQEAVRVSEEQYRLLFSSMNEGFCTIEMIFDEGGRPIDYRFLEINPTFERQTGLSDAKGKRIRELAEGFEQHWFDNFGQIALTGEPARFENRAGALGRWYEVSAFRVGEPELRRVGIVFNDITERKGREDEVREAAERFRFLAESMPQKIFTATPAGEVDYFNRQWMDFTGLTFEQIRDWGWVQFIHPDDVAENVRSWEYSIESGEPFYLQHRFRRADGTYRWHMSRAHAMRDADGKVVMWIGSNTDIEEIRQAKEEVERASRTKDEFLAALSHELRTPLTPVLMTLSTMRDETRLPLDVRDQLSMMKRNIELEARLIDDLLDLTRIAKGKLELRVESCDAHSLVALAIEMVRSEALRKRQTVEVDLAAHRSLINGDPARLQQVFWNVLKNAVKFTPESGRLAVRSHDAEDQLVIEVSDTGIGIDQASIERIFIPFEQAASLSAHHRFGGLGLGLSISRAIVDLHGGAIHAASIGQGSGATFRVELPASENLVAAVSEQPRRLDNGGAVGRLSDIKEMRPLRLLLVEDNEPTLAVLERLLTRAGHSVTTAMTVAGALATAAGPVKFDALISDVGLPDGTGFDLMETLRNTYGLQGIALSGYGMEEDLRRSREAGFTVHLTKPIDFAQLEHALATLEIPATVAK